MMIFVSSLVQLRALYCRQLYGRTGRILHSQISQPIIRVSFTHACLGPNSGSPPHDLLPDSLVLRQSTKPAAFDCDFE